MPCDPCLTIVPSGRYLQFQRPLDALLPARGIACRNIGQSIPARTYCFSLPGSTGTHVYPDEGRACANALRLNFSRTRTGFDALAPTLAN